MYTQASNRFGQSLNNRQDLFLGQADTSVKHRDLLFFGYSGAQSDGTKERDFSHRMVALTLKEHLLRRFPNDEVEIICAWHKNTFVKELMRPSSIDPKLKIRQIHYVGHGAGGGLFFGFRNQIAMDQRAKISATFQTPPSSLWPDEIKRMVALSQDAGLISGFFTDVLNTAALSAIKAQLAPGALMHVWGCFAGAPSHSFNTGDAYWNLFNAGGASVDGIARHIAKSLAIHVTAAWDPKGIHGMNFWYRNAAGKFETSKRPSHVPQWLWPATKSVRWITYNAAGVGDEKQIQFLGKDMPASNLKPGKPPDWFTREIPIARAKSKLPAPPTCSAVAVTL
jgi:hypothetical protein